MNRRQFLQASAVGAALAGNASRARAQRMPRVKAVAFDGLAIFDPRPVALEAERVYPGKSAELLALWRTRQFEYTWLRNSLGRYADFERVTEDALRFATTTLQLRLDGETRDRLMGALAEIRAWPDVAATLAPLRSAGYRLALLSNFTAAMLDRGVANSGLGGLFEPHLTTDLVQVYKPDPRAYAMAPRAFGLPRDRIAFVAFAGWDVAGATAYGFPTYWANRARARPEELAFPADIVRPGLEDLPAFLGA